MDWKKFVDALDMQERASLKYALDVHFTEVKDGLTEEEIAHLWRGEKVFAIRDVFARIGGANTPGNLRIAQQKVDDFLQANLKVSPRLP